MQGLADHLCATIETAAGSDDLTKWKELVPLIRSKGLEAALLEKAPPPTLEVLISSETGRLISAHELAVFEEVFSGKKVLRLTRLAKHFLKPTSGIPVITNNYDRLAELALEEAGLGVDTMFVGRFAGLLNERESRLGFCRNVTLKNGRAAYHYQPRAVVCKPHGSLDWYLRNGKPVLHSGNLTNASRLIITPGQNKFRNGYESPFDHHRNRANDAIDRGSRFLILGYGFNDDHLETHLSPAIRSGKPTLLMTHTLSPKARLLASQCSNVIALEQGADTNKVVGTNVLVDRSSHFYPNQNWWDVNSFISEVLEP
jgi:hypothetical protein